MICRKKRLLFIVVVIHRRFPRGFGQIKKSKMVDQDGHYPEMITQLLRHMTSSPHIAEVKGDIFRHTIYPPSLVVIVFIFSELQRKRVGGSTPDLPVVENKNSPV